MTIFPIIAHGEDNPNIFDNANLLSPDDITSLSDEVSALSGTTGFDVVLLTIDNANGQTSKDVADSYYDDNGYSNDGVLFLIDMDNREAYISTKGICKDYYDPARLEESLDGMVEYLKDEDYYGCFSYGLSQFNTYYNEGILVPNNNTDDIYDDNYEENISSSTDFSVSSFLTVGLIGAGIAIIICLTSVISGYKQPKGAPVYPLDHYGKLDLTENSDRLVNRIVTVRKIPKPTTNNNSNSSGGGGSSHGGGGKSF